MFDALPDEVRLKTSNMHTIRSYCVKKELVRLRGGMLQTGIRPKDLNTSQPLFQTILMTLDQIRILRRLHRMMMMKRTIIL